MKHARYALIPLALSLLGAEQCSVDTVVISNLGDAVLDGAEVGDVEALRSLFTADAVIGREPAEFVFEAVGDLGYSYTDRRHEVHCQALNRCRDTVSYRVGGAYARVAIDVEADPATQIFRVARVVGLAADTGALELAAPIKNFFAGEVMTQDLLWSDYGSDDGSIDSGSPVTTTDWAATLFWSGGQKSLTIAGPAT